MTVKTLKTNFFNSLEKDYPKTEIASFFYMLTEHILGLSRLDVSLNYNLEIFETHIEKFDNSIKKLKNHEPIQYIIGETEFYGLNFKVNKWVLIPRPETEELVEWIIKEFRIQNSEFRILDIGTGSGCIAISIAKNLPKTKVYALDVSKEAIAVAKDNAVLNNVQIRFIEANILKFESWNLEYKDLKFDLIVSNPPYVRELEKQKMSANVIKHEPHLALFVEDNDPLFFYRKILQFSSKNLKPKGKIYFEINEYLGNEIVNLFKEEGYKEIELKLDIFGKDRMIKGVKL